MINRWTLNIEAPIIATASASDAVQATLLLMDLLGGIPKGITTILYRKAFMDTVSANNEAVLILNKALSENDTAIYEIDDKSKYLKTEPDVRIGIQSADIVNEVGYQLSALGRTQNASIPLYIAQPERVRHEGKLFIRKDNKNVAECYMVDASDQCVTTLIDSFIPKLDQAKHHQFEHQLGGHKVSKFSAYDKNDETLAKMLLQDAYDHYSGRKLPADYLWAWDKLNHCYVKFFHSGRCQYHGYDETDFSKVPDEVKYVYGIWK